MGLVDALWLMAILGGAAYLLHRSLGKSNGHCAGCQNRDCSRRTLCLAASLLGCLLAPASPNAAAELVAPPAPDPPRASGSAEFYHTPAEKVTAGLSSRLAGQITFSGLLEVEASVDRSGNDIALTTAQFGLGVRVDQAISGTLVVLAEDGGGPAIDEATIDLAAGRWCGRAGLQLLPFGHFRSHFVTDPLTLELGETKQSALLGNVTADWLALSVFIFGGGARLAGDEQRIEDWGAALTVTLAEGVEIGVSYLSDLADTGAGLLADAGDRYQRRVGGWSAYAVATLGPLEFAAEGLGALDDFAAADGGGRPTAWNLELAWVPVPAVELALRHEWGQDLPGAVQRRYGAAASWSPRQQVSITAEFLRAETEGGGESAATARLALEF